MKSIQVANAFILRHGSDTDITNLVLNKLVYFAQVESLRKTESRCSKTGLRHGLMGRSKGKFILPFKSTDVTGLLNLKVKPQKMNGLYPSSMRRRRNMVF